MNSPEGNQRSEEGQWSFPQMYSEQNDINTAERSPPPTHVYYSGNSPPPKEPPWEGYEVPGSPGGHSAPEVVYPYQYQPQHNRTMSPSSVGGSTVVSPHIPPFLLSPKVEPTPNFEPGPPPEESKILGIRKKRFSIILMAIAIALVALGLGLGLGLGFGWKRHKDAPHKIDPYCLGNPDLCIGGALDEAYLSKKGAFNGSGIALAGESWNKDQRKIFTLYFQHWTGEIRFMQYTTDKKWIGGTKSEIVATDAKNSTPISAVAYVSSGQQFFHIFYVSKDSTLRQKTTTNITNIWESGPLSDLNLKVWDAPTVGLQACWKGNFYGDSDFSKFPTPSGQENVVPYEEMKGMNIWYAVDESTFRQYAWYEIKNDTWAKLELWQGKNGPAGVGCYSWGEGTTTYAMMVNKDNYTEFWWKDTNKNLTSEDAHPINSWKNSTMGAIGPVYPSTSLGYTTYFYAQMADRTIKGFNVSYQAENTTIVPKDTFTLTDPAGPVKGLGGTHLTVTAYAEMDNKTVLWDSLYVFYQTEGDDIAAFTRPIAGGEWSRGNLAIPLE